MKLFYICLVTLLGACHKIETSKTHQDSRSKQGLHEDSPAAHIEGDSIRVYKENSAEAMQILKDPNIDLKHCEIRLCPQIYQFGFEKKAACEAAGGTAFDQAIIPVDSEDQTCPLTNICGEHVYCSKEYTFKLYTEVYTADGEEALKIRSNPQENLNCPVVRCPKNDNAESKIGRCQDAGGKVYDGLVIPLDSKDSCPLIACDKVFCTVPYSTNAKNEDKETILYRSNGESIILNDQAADEDVICPVVDCLWDDHENNEEIIEKEKACVANEGEVFKGDIIPKDAVVPCPINLCQREVYCTKPFKIEE